MADYAISKMERLVLSANRCGNENACSANILTWCVLHASYLRLTRLADTPRWSCGQVFGFIEGWVEMEITESNRRPTFVNWKRTWIQDIAGRFLITKMDSANSLNAWWPSGL